ncbi:MAG: ROK family transcriptional regulator [Clostridia bacterium]|nr:ROK family transcriptional regulator [Clostridia bacterium]NCC41981.1 ROK family transcriptional regulator [Clostridia bacterium]
MKSSITPNQIKQNNRKLIYQYIYQKRKVSQQDIAYDLHLSRPTVATNISTLEQEGLIQKCGQIDTEYVGRKAAAYSIVSDFRISLGVEILKKEIKIIAVDLNGEKIGRTVYEIAYENSETYIQTVCDKIIQFKDTLSVTDEQILGIGFAMQALISPDKKTVLYGKILDCTGLSIHAFAKHLSYPCFFVHDAESAAISEMWISPELTDAFYLSISKHLGAAIICNGKILDGKHGHSSTIEHITMEPDGQMCYCGKKGCMETLCSLESLLTDSETLEDFFEHLHQEEVTYTSRWKRFLTDLARSINTLHLVYDTDFILGGYIAPFLTDKDLDFLHQEVCHMTPFPEANDFIQISKMPKHNIAIGAALPYIQEFLDTINGAVALSS